MNGVLVYVIAWFKRAISALVINMTGVLVYVIRWFKSAIAINRII